MLTFPQHIAYPFLSHSDLGLRNAAQTFQRFIDEVLRGLDFVYAYIDDVLIASSSEVEHLAHLDILFHRLSEYGIVINPSNCIFGAASLEFLGHQISVHGISPLPQKCKLFKTFLLHPPYASYANSLVWSTSIVLSFHTVLHLSNHLLISYHQSEPVPTHFTSPRVHYLPFTL